MRDLDLFDGTLGDVQCIEGIPHALTLCHDGKIRWLPIRRVTVYESPGDS